jgi:hypothetical protein
MLLMGAQSLRFSGFWNLFQPSQEIGLWTVLTILTGCASSKL